MSQGATEGGEKRICEAYGCGAVIPMGMLMCGPHWAMVPTELQQKIYRLWHQLRRGRVDVVADYRAAVKAAVTIVSGKRRRRRPRAG